MNIKNNGVFRNFLSFQSVWKLNVCETKQIKKYNSVQQTISHTYETKISVCHYVFQRFSVVDFTVLRHFSNAWMVWGFFSKNCEINQLCIKEFVVRSYHNVYRNMHNIHHNTTAPIIQYCKTRYAVYVFEGVFSHQHTWNQIQMKV